MGKLTPVQQFPSLANFGLDNAVEMIVWTRPDGSIFYVNATCCLSLGYQEDELLGKSLSLLMEVPEDWKGKWDSLKKDRRRNREYSVRSADNRPVAVKAREFYLDVDGGGAVCLFWLASVTREDQTESVASTQERFHLKEIRMQQNTTGIISRNRKYRSVLKQVEQVADTQATVLIEGETGTGKELLANAIHQLSGRRNRPFVKVNCAAIPEHLAGSELFGHEKGAFTGAFQRKIGRFELADGGTLLLDEIGELPLHLQPKLLRILQEGEFERLGGNKTLRVDVRLIAATNRDLTKMIGDGDFREDLYFRLSVFPIRNLPLRERKDDIPLLAKFFIEKFNQKMGKQVREISGDDMQALMNYDFPGNIRELENIVERAIILSKGETLNLRSFLLQK